MRHICDAIRHATEAARLRDFARRHDGLGDLLGLADHHSRLAAQALEQGVRYP